MRLPAGSGEEGVGVRPVPTALIRTPGEARSSAAVPVRPVTGTATVPVPMPMAVTATEADTESR